MYDETMIKTKVAEKLKVLAHELETILSPLIVFCIGYLHHLYFRHDLISPTFVAGSLLSVILVLAYQRQGLYASGMLQVCFIVWVAVSEPTSFLEQAIFSAAVLAALTATHLAQEPVVEV